MATPEEVAQQIRDLQQQLETLCVNSAPAQDAPRVPTQRAKIHLPKFTRNSPELWFAQVERSFRLHSISDDTDKFDFVAVHLEDEVVLAVEDLIIRPPTTDKYDALKARLLQRFAESPESKLRCLLQGGGYTGQKPSEILAHMRRLAPDPGSESIIRSLFLSEMPQSVRPLLSVWDETDIDKLAKLADKMLDAVGTSTTYAISPSPQCIPAEDHTVNAVGGSGTLKEISNSLRSLTQKFENLQKDVKRLQSPNRSRNQPRSPARDQQNASSGDSNRLSTPACLADVKQPSVSTVQSMLNLQDLLQEFVDVTNPSVKTTRQHEVRHYIDTNGCPVSDRPRRLAGEKLTVAKKEFNFLIEQGICRPSNSPWSSPLHMVSVMHDVFELVKNLFGSENLDQQTYAQITEKLTEHYKEKRHIVAARYEFFKRQMRDSQTHKEWVADLRGIARECQFVCKSENCSCDYVNEMIRDQIIVHTQFDKIRTAALQKLQPSLEDVLSIAETYEATTKTVSAIKESEKKALDTNAVYTQKHQHKKRSGIEERNDKNSLKSCSDVPNSVPKFYKSRPIPFAQMEKFKEEAQRLTDAGIWKPVKFSSWASPIVLAPKPGGTSHL
ncbi:hypothetical protein ACLKA7_011533 [Drosophila subpalustris]